MDDRRFDALSRALGAARSRRGVVRLLGGLGGGLAAPWPWEPLVAGPGRCTPTCGECQTCRRKCAKRQGRKSCKGGTCKPKPNGTPCSNGGTCEAGACVGFGGCPPACPACQACPSEASLCAAQPNGQPGHQCEEPSVCCNGICCEFIHECNSDGGCATCEQACPEDCELCLTLSNGSKVCGGAGSHCTGSPCGDCPVDLPFFPACVTSVTDRATNTTRQDCGVPVGTGACWDIAPCCPPCPVCQDCNLRTVSCQVFPENNGQPGHGCAAPKVCCNGICCDPIHQCNSQGACATCADACTDTQCAFCLARVTGGRICAGAASSCRDQTCKSDDDCNAGEFCVTSVTDRATNTTTQGCGEPVGAGVCWHNVACRVV